MSFNYILIYYYISTYMYLLCNIYMGAIYDYNLGEN